MNIAYFLQLTVSGLSVGMIYALIGLGLMLTIRASGLTNFAQGNTLAMGAFVAYEIIVKLKVESSILQIVIGLLFFICFGCIFCCVCFFPFRNSKWGQTMLISTMGMGTIISELCSILISRQNRRLDPIVDGSLKLGNFVLDYQYIFVLVIATLLVIGVYLLFDKLYCGRILSAAAQNKYAANILGINTTFTTLLTFCINAVIVCFAGWIISPIYMVRSTLSTFQSKAYAGIVVGGYGNLVGSVLGGIIIGLIESYATIFTTSYRDAVVYLFLIIVLIFKPNGLFKGVGYQEKA